MYYMRAPVHTTGYASILCFRNSVENVKTNLVFPLFLSPGPGLLTVISFK